MIGGGRKTSDCGAILPDSLVPSDSKVVLVSKLNRNQPFRTMIEHFVAAKKFRSQLPQASLLMAFMIVESCAWWEKRRATAASTLDDEIRPGRSDLQRIWHRLDLIAGCPLVCLGSLSS